MDEARQQGIFDIKITASGKSHIRKFAVAARIVILTGLIISFIHITVTLIRLIKINPAVYPNDKQLQIEHTLIPYYLVIYCVFYFLQMYFYWQVTRYLRKGLNYNDEETFNKAFQALYRYSLFGVISMTFSLLFYTFELYWHINDYFK